MPISNRTRLMKWIETYARRAPLAYRQIADYRIRRLSTLFQPNDFQITRVGQGYQLRFDDRCGYQPVWNYAPYFEYSADQDAWLIRINDIRFYVRELPFIELVADLRGYTLLGDAVVDGRTLDAGPYTGLSGIYFAKCATAGQVVFVEPDPQALRLLHGNLRLNRLSNCMVIDKAVHSHVGTVRFSRAAVGSNHILREGDDDPTAYSVQTVSLRALLHAQPHPFNLVKMDIEGSEYDLIPEIGDLVHEFTELVFVIASYHQVGGAKTSVHFERAFAGRSDVYLRTLFPYHESTIIANSRNTVVKTLLENVRYFPQRRSLPIRPGNVFAN